MAHCDPASDAPAISLALDYSVVLRSQRGERVVPLDGFFEGPFQTAMEADELIVKLRRGPLPAGATGAYRKLAQPASGYSIVGVAAVVASIRWLDLPRSRGADRGRRGARTGRRPSRPRSSAATDRRAPSRRRPRMRRTARRSTTTSMPTATIGRTWPSSTRDGRSRARWDARSATDRPSEQRAGPSRHSGSARACAAGGRDPRARPDRLAVRAGRRAGACQRTTSWHSPPPILAIRSASSSRSRASSTRTRPPSVLPPPWPDPG